MIISRATLEDISSLSILFDEYRVFYQKESNVQEGAAFLSDRIKNNESVIFVARSEEGILMGFVQLYPIFSSVRMKRLWLLNDLYVNPNFRGLKVSVKLIDAVKKIAMETNSAGLILETAKTNNIGNKLYARTDFVLDSDHNYYSWTY